MSGLNHSSPADIVLPWYYWPDSISYEGVCLYLHYTLRILLKTESVKNVPNASCGFQAEIVHLIFICCLHADTLKSCAHFMPSLACTFLLHLRTASKHTDVWISFHHHTVYPFCILQFHLFSLLQLRFCWFDMTVFETT
jgi:hypothetical protein